MFFIPPTSEESALDGAEQAAAPGVVHTDVGAPWRSEKSVGSISQDTQIQCQCSPGSSPHLKLSFLFGFLRFLAVSLAVFSCCLG